ncbi:MAG: hypothetical protein Q8O55_01375 [Dehalococcoidales bacterium]|nr:hypothetical protein [Dehalococcoidales bacterium]
MAFLVVDSPFNRANYQSIIGKVYEVAPSYAQVQPVEYTREKRESQEECAALATKVIKIYAVSDALTHGWQYLEPERRAESLGRLKERVEDLFDAKQISSKTTADVMEQLKVLEGYNLEKGVVRDVAIVLLPAVVDMAVAAIGECVCGEKAAVKAIPTRDQVRVEDWSERDRRHIGIQVIETGEYLAGWWDEDAEQMFVDGFFKSGLGERAFEDSVLEYAEDMGILAK